MTWFPYVWVLRTVSLDTSEWLLSQPSSLDSTEVDPRDSE